MPSCSHSVAPNLLKCTTLAAWGHGRSPEVQAPVGNMTHSQSSDTSKTGKAATTTTTTLCCPLVHFPQFGCKWSDSSSSVGAPRSQRGDMGSQPRGPKHGSQKGPASLGSQPKTRSQRSTLAFFFSPSSQHKGVVVWGAVKSRRCQGGWVVKRSLKS